MNFKKDAKDKSKKKGVYIMNPGIVAALLLIFIGVMGMSSKKEKVK
ncbi:hypothetical protein J2Z83_003048 [Virgibacillus natechei]|uniref:Uncharacterized protein n=1 Tax=Virgibacillus natechei TaxID=1216297 RepID=A0ABS4IIX4_9BACI|nr:hypothetical protein [Virgibacillus natechei]MBP1970912.1 hypothetical protein [Virgibacillus natechei]UZD13294.1 hypothetical protein OLD84_01630 [Virgibacillus natechei]